MVSLFGNKSSGWIGIDIGSSSVKLVSMCISGNRPQIDAYAIVSLPDNAVVDGSIEEVSSVASSIERGLKICGGKFKSAVVAVPSSAVITKKIQVSNLFQGIELEDQIKIEADQFIPYPLDEVALDFEVLGPANKDPNMNEILLVACRKDASESREDAVNASGIKCEVVDVDTYAMERVVPLLDQAPTGYMIAVVDVGASTLCLNVFENGAVVYNREQAFAGNELSQSITQQYGMLLEDVVATLHENKVSQEIQKSMIEPFTNSVVQQVSRALQFFYSSGLHGQLSKVYICGGVSALPNLTSRLKDDLDLDAELLNPFEHCSINRNINTDRLKLDSALLVKACGLALRSIVDRTQ